MRGETSRRVGVAVIALHAIACEGDSKVGNSGQAIRDAASSDRTQPEPHGTGDGASAPDGGRGTGGTTQRGVGGSLSAGGEGAGGASALDGAATGRATADGGSDGSVGRAAADGGIDGSADGGALTFVDYQSGKRLRAMFYEIPGVRVWHGWFDVKLGVPCKFVTADDGNIRCVPTDMYANRFGDAQCRTTPAYVPDQAACAPPKFVAARTDACGTIAVYAVGAATTISNTFPAYQSGYCLTQGSVSEQGYALSKRAASDFVSATVMSDARTADLGVSYYLADDGARQPLSAYDEKRMSACDPAGAAAPYSHRCVPAHTAAGGNYGNVTYSDTNCTEPVASIPICDANQATAVLVTTSVMDAGVVSPEVSYANLGGSAALGSHNFLTSGVPGTCQTSPYYDTAYFEIGASIAPSELPTVEVVELGGSRIKARYYASSEGRLLTFLGFYDTALALPCSATVSDAGVRCFPDATSSTGYADDQCTTPIALTLRAFGQQSFPAYAVTTNAPACAPSTYALWKVESLDTHAPIYEKSGDGCVWQLEKPPGSATCPISPIASSTLGAIEDAIE